MSWTLGPAPGEADGIFGMSDHDRPAGPRGVFGSSPVRFVVMSILVLLAYTLPQLPAVVVKSASGPTRLLLVYGGAAAACALALLTYTGLVCLMERRWPGELALRPRLAVAGAGLGMALFCTVYAVLFAQGLAHWSGVSGLGGVAAALSMAIASGIGEELVFRGVAYRVIEESCGTLVALLASAAIFGLLHGANPGASAISTGAIALEAGVLLAASYLATRNLWFPIGLHLGWNFAEGGVFGVAVSGHPATGILNAPLSGPALLTGGAFGPEASPAAVAVCLCAALAMLVVAARRGQWKPFTLRLYPR